MSVDTPARKDEEAQVKQVTLSVDGVDVSVPEGTLVIRAAEQIGVQIPRFCDHPLLDPVGACRQCLVEVSTPDREGNLRPMPKPQASCTLTASEGMVVQTQHTSPVADKAQQGVMELLLVNHPLDCPVCDKGGECPLQNQAMSNGRPRSRFEDVKRTFPKPINISSQVLLDRERCVLCARCTRFSDQIAGDPFIALIERGALQQVGIYEEQPFESYFSGNTVQICPVGALTGAAYRFRSRPFDLVSTPSVCEHCASGCSLRVDTRRGTVLRRMALEDPEVNEEWNCDKGRWAFPYAALPDRLVDPVVREDGVLRVASWTEALQAAADGLRAARDRAGVGVLTGGRMSLEDAYAYSKFARVALGTHDLDFRARPHSAEEAEFLAATVAGRDVRSSVTFETLEHTSAVLLVGLEPEEEAASIFLRLRKANRRHGLPITAVAPLATRGLEKLGGRLLRAAPGTEAEVMRALVSADDAGTLAEVARTLTPDAVILVGERLATVPGALSAAAALAESTGARLAWVPRRAGDRGALEAGVLPGLLPGGRPVGDAGAVAQLEAAWGSVLPTTPGRDATAILQAAADGALSGLVIGGVDPDDLPDSALARRALERAFVVSLELRETDVHAYADVILPVAPMQEKEGTFVNWEGRRRPFQQPLAGQTQSDHEVLDKVADRMGHRLDVGNLPRVRAALEALGPWAGTPAAVPDVEASQGPSVAAGEAVLASWHLLLDRGSLQDGEPFLAGTAKRPVARVSAATAAAAGVTDGEGLGISTPHGAITLPVVVTDMLDHVVWVPANSPGSRVLVDLRAVPGEKVRLAPATLTDEREFADAAATPGGRA